MEQRLTYKKCRTVEQANEVVEVLHIHNITFEVEDQSRNLPEFFLGQDMEDKILIKISARDFERANKVLEDYADSQLDQVEKDYHLYSFDNDELLEILTEPDKWNELDKQLAKKILKDRGVTITPELEETLYEERIEELKLKEQGSTIWTSVGYIFACLGGLLCIAIGLSLMTLKKTLPDGSRTYVYADKDRKHGEKITILGIVMFILWIYVRYRFLRF